MKQLDLGLPESSFANDVFATEQNVNFFISRYHLRYCSECVK